jgi:ATP adenylyltransferase
VENLWTPWRIEYIEKHKDDECFFCKYIKEDDDKKNKVLFRSKYSFIVMNIFPYNSGHLMVAPYRHTGNFLEIKEEELSDIMRLTQICVAVLKEVLNPEGFNIGINIGRVAGAGVEGHIHIHIVPRWNGDTNFMPVLADVKTIPEHIERTYERLKPFFDKYNSEKEVL